MSAFIDVKNLTKTFNGSGKSFTALDGVSFTMERGDLVVVSGKSGSGKSTLLNMLSGIDQPTGGEVLIDMIPIHKFKGNQLAAWRGRNVGIVFQFFQLMPTLTLIENIMLPMEFAGSISRNKQKQRALELLDRMDIVSLADKFPGSVSGGEKQRIAIARALANNPEFIIADEPTGNLDSINTNIIHELFNSLAAEGKTIIYVTHEISTALRYDRKLEMVDGKISNN